jgi:ribonuclease BN (tRNA processing enzyme)
VPESLSLKETKEGIYKFDGFTLTARKTPHIESSLAYRIESSGKSLVYSGDTDYSEPLIELAKDADTLIIECSVPDELKVKGHLTPTEVVKIANESRAKKIIISHLYPICDKTDIIRVIGEHTEADVVLAEDLLEIEI